MLNSLIKLTNGTKPNKSGFWNVSQKNSIFRRVTLRNLLIALWLNIKAEKYDGMLMSRFPSSGVKPSALFPELPCTSQRRLLPKHLKQLKSHQEKRT